ncbi:MAG TPA: LuxR C-terminal-related transcriptional regulator [Kribbella sp.]|uniref:LuxR C-terminal-related transcriptional regulator n=1 Tax=Kribbella sp. TaxID=1871183 RepID=UPI002D798826|nr:LuxR C-terminal-related transcriptional regulator [Kribbella sp.]HET6293870.1 LuxR C-terminal-related transcriptional regulator [Kribbella sp.]
MGAGDRLEMLIRRCYAGLETDALRAEVLDRLRGILTVDAAFIATVDPATLLFTSATAEDPLGTVTEAFLDNEFGRSDVNKFTALAAAADPVNSLDHATRGDWSSSSRYVEVMAPLGLGDELRAALRSGGRCWGMICLHRADAGSGFSERELTLVRRLGPHLAEGFRRSLLATKERPATEIGPGVIVLTKGFEVVASSPEAEHWLTELDHHDDPMRRTELPVAVRAAAAQLTHVHELPAAPVLKVRTRAGRWLAVHASTLSGAGDHHIAVVIEPATPTQLGSFLLDLHGLTPAQQRVTELVLRGRSTRQIIEQLHLSPHTVQEHVRAAYDKVGVGSRRELIAALLGDH